jgi:hypothetical protein
MLLAECKKQTASGLRSTSWQLLAMAGGPIGKACQRSGAHMVLDPFGITRGCGVVDSQRQEKSIDNLMTLAAAGSQTFSLGREGDRLIRFRGQQPFLLQTINDPIYRDVAYTKPASQVDQATRSLQLCDIGHGFDIVFRRF